MPFVVGETIGPYRIIEQLGRGGMATVFKAYHAALDRYVAIKALHPAFMADPNFLARFQREAQVVARLEHPNIVPIYDFSEYEGRPYLVMKYIEGETLKARLNRDPINRDELIHVTEAVGSGLAYAHEQGILHRDVKPSNVLLGQDGRVYLADFGLARIAEAGESTLSSDMMLGTPQYISPEQAMGVRELDACTDIYSFGVMLYELVVGQVPFISDTPFSIIHDHIYTPLPLPRQVNADVSDAIERVLLKALAKDRADRHADAILLVEAFKQAILEDPVQVPVEVDSSSVATPTPPVVPPAPVALIVEAAPTVLTSEEEKTESLIVEPDEVKPDAIPATAEKKPRKRLRWWQIALAAIIVFLCCIVSTQILSKIRDGNIRRPSSQIDESGEDGLLEDLLEEAEKKPDDPYTHLDLAIAFWDRGQYTEAIAAIEKAIELADGDAEVFWQVTDITSKREMWLPTAVIYLELARAYPDELPEYFVDYFYQAVFMAAEDPEAEKGIPIPAIAEVDEIIEKVVKARFQLYSGNPDEAQATIDEVLNEIKPGMPEAILVQAEINFWQGDIQRAREILSELEERDHLPDWIWEYIKFLIDEINAYDDHTPAIVESPPGGLQTHLELLEALLETEKLPEAEAEVNRILEIGGDDPGVCYKIAQILCAHGNFLYAVPLFALSVSLYGESPPQELIDSFHMAVYFGSAEFNAMEMLSDPEFRLPPERIDLAQARHLLYHGDMDNAKSMIGQLLNDPPYLPEERLLEAEMYIQLDDFNPAEAILMDLQADENIPLWIQNEASTTLAEIRQ